MEYLIHHVKFEMWPALCKSLNLFSTVKLKLRHKFGTFESCSLAVLTSFSQFTKRLKIGIFECCSSWTSQFSQFVEETGNSDFLI